VKSCVGDEDRRVKFLKFDRERNRVSLGRLSSWRRSMGSYSKLVPREYESKRLKVTNLTDYAIASLELEEGVEGLVPRF